MGFEETLLPGFSFGLVIQGILVRPGSIIWRRYKFSRPTLSYSIVEFSVVMPFSSLTGRGTHCLMFQLPSLSKTMALFPIRTKFQFRSLNEQRKLKSLRRTDQSEMGSSVFRLNQKWELGELFVFFWTMQTEGNEQTVEHCRWTLNFHKWMHIVPSFPLYSLFNGGSGVSVLCDSSDDCPNWSVASLKKEARSSSSDASAIDSGQWMLEIPSSF